ncbi:cation:proton antiporter [Trichocoleus sp. FACHB-262]|uniref:cation:proton antiporter domain-containing protein n=1 Tax=Trichocoleus sp. FACHB-262 TaxID=2692869 RepID=UPI001684B80E|nr:cation:proton antiporter [Trichocoleus sp. FACHB-262]MBD2123825.1 cation:proton antiporter [Trichocoleus sp. FACHB-262]
MESILKFFEEPIVSFAVLLAVILTVPILVERFRIPGLVGLLAAGVVLGPNGLHLLQKESETLSLLAEIGLLYLMFVSGLEVDIEEFRRKKYRSIGYGSLTFAIPLIFGTVVGRLFGFDWNASVLIGSLFASHTLLAYPMVSRLGVVSNEAVTVTIGATIFTDVGSLLVLAICIGINAGDFTATKLAILLGSLAIYSVVVLFGFDWAGRQFFKRTGDDEGNQFLFVLLAIFLASLGAQLIGVEKIVGAFLAGLAVNDAVGQSPVKEKVVFVGSVLFIPIFFVNLGLLIDIPAFIASISSIWLTLAIVTGLIISKFLAAYGAKLLYRYNQDELLTMWSMSMPQVGATLAATLVGYRAGMLTEGVLNSVIVLMLVTATLGPLITSRVAPRLITSDTTLEPDTTPSNWGAGTTDHPFTVVVPVYNPKTEQYLIEMAALLARYESGRIVPLAIATAQANMDTPTIGAAMERSEALLANAKAVSQEIGVEAEPLLRIDDGIAQGISRASREQDASLIVMGWGRRTGFRARIFGNVLDSVLWSSHCPVAITRLLNSPSTMQRILVPIDNLGSASSRTVQFAQMLAAANQATVTLLHITDRRASAGKRAWTESQLAMSVAKWAPQLKPEIQVVSSDNVVTAILQAAKSCDLVVLRSLRRRTNAGLDISDVTTQVAQQLTCSVVLLGEPQRSQPSVVVNPTRDQLATQA